MVRPGIPDSSQPLFHVMLVGAELVVNVDELMTEAEVPA